MSEKVPNGWREAALGDLVDESNDRVGRIAPLVLSSTKHHGLVPSSEYFQGRTIYSNDLSNYKRVDRGWFAYATNHLAEGSIGLQWAFDSACVSPIYTVFKCKNSVDPRFLYRVLKSPEIVSQYGLHEQASVDRRGAVRFHDFSTIRIELPNSITEQRLIANFLESVDGQIGVSQKIIGKLAALDDLLTREMLDRQDCPVYLMRNLCSEITVGIVVRPSQYYRTSGIPVLRSMNVKAAGIDLAEVQYMSTGDHRRMSKSAVCPGDVVTVRTGAPGVSAVIPPSLPEANCGDIIISRPNSTVIPEYLCFWINSEFGRGQVLRGQGGLAQQHFNVHEMNTLEVTVPSIERQRYVVDALTASRNRIRAEQCELVKLQLLKQSLTDDLLTGRVRMASGGTERVGTV